MRLFIAFAFFVILLSYAESVFAHSGRTNAMGCHTNRGTGDYHCHNRRAPATNQTTYCHVNGLSSNCGYAHSSCQKLVQKFGGYCKLN